MAGGSSRYIINVHLYIVRSDYSQVVAGKVTFTPGGPNEQTVPLSVDEDQFLELNETYLLRLHLPDTSINAGAKIGTIDKAQVTIINDDSKISEGIHLQLMCNVCMFQKFKYSSRDSLQELENLSRLLFQLDSTHRRQIYLLQLE